MKEAGKKKEKEIGRTQKCYSFEKSARMIEYKANRVLYTKRKLERLSCGA